MNLLFMKSTIIFTFSLSPITWLFLFYIVFILKLHVICVSSQTKWSQAQVAGSTDLRVVQGKQPLVIFVAAIADFNHM